MLRYVETLFRHRLLLTVPMLLLVVLCAGWVLVQPPTYASTVRLWVERQQLVSNPNDNPYITPAQEQTNVLVELLNTKYFCLKVGRRSPLAKVMSDPGATQPGIGQRLLSTVGLASSSGSALSGPALDDAVFFTLSRQTLVYPAGPQIITITFSGGSPELSAQVTQAIADQFVDEKLASQRVQSDAAIDFYSGQVKQAQAELSAADAALDQYVAAHPEQRAANAVPDARLVQLRRNDENARQRYDELQGRLDQSTINHAALSRPDTSGMRVLDKAEIPGRNSVKRLMLAAGVVGALLALVILVVGILLLTLVDNTFRRPEEVEQALDLRPVGTVPRLS
jgi:uncharacterized protein involved in exopolysaccharide biosynthesis